LHAACLAVPGSHKNIHRGSDRWLYAADGGGGTADPNQVQDHDAWATWAPCRGIG